MAAKSRHNGSPLSFDLVDLPPEGRDLQGTLAPAMLELDTDGLAEALSEVEFSLHLAEVNSGKDLLVTGSIRSSIAGYCDRCNAQCSLAVEDDEICHQYENAFGTTVDLTDDIREDVIMALPSRMLCSEECLGLCPMCGQNLNEGACECQPLSDEELARESGESSPWDELDRLSDK
ncbi:MAG: DUF177 domain-containing protein [Victivallales bacterium]|nr:DUF177 domain-containing protein [Victivallales bacterium]